MSLELNVAALTNPFRGVQAQEPFINIQDNAIKELTATNLKLTMLASSQAAALSQVEGMLANINSKPANEQAKIMQHANALRTQIINKYQRMESTLRARIITLKQGVLPMVNEAFKFGEGIAANGGAGG
jgi:hypothetical protein